ncbi:DUF1294 domain-containing protein [Methylophilus aquaticus]|uniref:DUF1294 domain-containing protein n=1 Tax=Methylophilus aquaticus TaxID=1971610 RepID=A0ABT9JQW7_9PROT|nr:DUF1294 domain-containing protein [Methylophilus aquaticus]MDP8566955.1 DUF1294 domain-containing protein [Methylophilus aquaticus]
MRGRANPSRIEKKAVMPSGLRVMLSSVALAVLPVLVYRTRLPVHGVLWLVLISLATFLVYWLDKDAARHREWRVPERTLQWLSVLGGWPGALLAQGVLRHKSRKLRFQVWFWMAVAMHLLLMHGLAHADGQQFLHAVGRIVHQVVM